MALPPYRYVMAVLLSIGMAIIYGLRVNLNIAIVSMVNHTALSSGKREVPIAHTEEECAPSPVNDTKTEDGPFIWTPDMQGIMLSSYYWGYLIAMFPGSQMAEIVSAKWVFFFAVAINVVCTIGTPISCYTHYSLVYIMRILQGIGGGVTFPTTHVLLAHWAPPIERSIMGSIAFSGTFLGTVLSNLLCGVIAIKLGWEWIFYIMGTLSSIWLLLWGFLVTSRPRGAKLISQKELDMIEESLGEKPSADGEVKKKKRRKVPWLSIARSLPFWAILVAHTGSNWSFYMLLVNMPIFMKQVLKFNMAEVTLFSSIPYFTMWVCCICVGQTMDILRKKKKLTTTWARKIATLIASVPVACCLFGLCFINCQKTIAVILLTLALTAIGAMYSGFMTNHIDIANNYAGTLMGLTNTIGTIPGIVGPLFVGAMINIDPSMASWRIIFYVTIIIIIIEIIAFTTFGTGEEQPWNKQEQAQQPQATQ